MRRSKTRCSTSRPTLSCASFSGVNRPTADDIARMHDRAARRPTEPLAMDVLRLLDERARLLRQIADTVD
jgi:hypothetical protein